MGFSDMRILPLAGIVLIAWVLIIGEIFLFFEVILEYTPPIHELGSLTVLAVLKVGATLGLGVLWFVVMSFLAQLYTSSKLKSRPPSPSS
jgi:hypothetical protein